ncbi:hypothetical protein KUTeg_013074 [Tegillarca granosa]|uniref:Uncharacterized protein n=1 Tax=Tegillarca granosa TaxID=220873 RepID=A0ABQ9EWQ7_TEGGR|nr:hypothetical protein KUTeg_013074 [Tegillarca granosa]
MKRVGYWMSEKKSRRLKFEDHKDFFRNADIDLIKLHLQCFSDFLKKCCFWVLLITLLPYVTKLDKAFIMFPP